MWRKLYGKRALIQTRCAQLAEDEPASQLILPWFAEQHFQARLSAFGRAGA
jgi:hypothetical protein